MAEAGFPGAQGAVDGRQLGFLNDGLLADQDALEEGLVEQPPLQGRAGEIGRVGGLGLVECSVEIGLDVAGVQLDGVEHPLDLLLLAFQAVLLADEHLIGDDALVGELHQSGLVVLQFLDLALVALDVADYHSGALLSIAPDVGPYALADLWTQADGAVVLDDRLLDLGCRVVAAGAGASLLARRAFDAAEVLIEAAVAAVLAVEQPAAAECAVERAS